LLLLESRKIKNSINNNFSKNEIVSLIYHSIFNYPLSQKELIKWFAGDKASKIINKSTRDILSAKISLKNGYFYLKGQDNFIFQRLLKKRIGERKKIMAQRAAKILAFIPTIDLVALTGAVAMNNANENSDIDLLIVTKKGTLWTTRIIAHEIAQVIPLVNKEKTYEKFILKNKWIKDFWPNAVSFKQEVSKVSKNDDLILSIIEFVEPLAYRLQKWYMREKITREVVTPTRAIFHPVNWGSLVKKRFNQLLV